jgi:hypothetical protein
MRGWPFVTSIAFEAWLPRSTGAVGGVAMKARRRKMPKVKRSNEPTAARVDDAKQNRWERQGQQRSGLMYLRRGR